MDPKTDEFIKKNYVEKGLKFDLINVGSSLKILWIAENKADIYPRLAPTSEWDTCAAHAILNACGGVLEIAKNEQKSDLEAEELYYNKSNLLNPYFIGYIKTLFDKIHHNDH
jgi:3'(2'), 5'-bisphosphate nucleotidase